MGEIRIVGPGKTRGYPYPVCKKMQYTSYVGVSFFFFFFIIISCFLFRITSRQPAGTELTSWLISCLV